MLLGMLNFIDADSVDLAERLVFQAVDAPHGVQKEDENPHRGMNSERRSHGDFDALLAGTEASAAISCAPSRDRQWRVLRAPHYCQTRRRSDRKEP